MPPRKPMIPFGFSLPSDFKISDANWNRLEKAYGHPIPAEARVEITAATRRMISRSATEHSRRPMSEALRHMIRLEKATNKLLAAWTASDLPSDSINFAQEVIEQELSPITLDDLHSYLMHFPVACTRASAKAASVAVYIGEAQDIWIR